MHCGQEHENGSATFSDAPPAARAHCPFADGWVRVHARSPPDAELLSNWYEARTGGRSTEKPPSSSYPARDHRCTVETNLDAGLRNMHKRLSFFLFFRCWCTLKIGPIWRLENVTLFLWQFSGFSSVFLKNGLHSMSSCRSMWNACPSTTTSTCERGAMRCIAPRSCCSTEEAILPAPRGLARRCTEARNPQQH